MALATSQVLSSSVGVAAPACSEMEHMPCVTQQVKGRQQEDSEKKGTMSELEVGRVCYL